MAYGASLTLLTRHGRVSVSSQLMTELVRALSETHTVCTRAWSARISELDVAYRKALSADGGMDPDERDRLGRLHLKFLRTAVKWSESLGAIRYGDRDLHETLGRHCWRMSKAGGADGSGVEGGQGDGGGVDAMATGDS